jgi:hypothetical protein
MIILIQTQGCRFAIKRNLRFLPRPLWTGFIGRIVERQQPERGFKNRVWRNRSFPGDSG